MVWIATGPTSPLSPPASRPAAGTREPTGLYAPTVGQAGKDVVWVPTSAALVDKMLDIAQVTATDYVIDLGSGDGRTVIAAARRGARALGIEFNPEMVGLSLKRLASANVGDRATVRRDDFFKTDLSQATVITMFLLPRLNVQLRPRLLRLAPGTRIVSNSFDMADWQPDAADTVRDAECQKWCTALLWVVPARVAGTWTLPDGVLELAQTFQRVTGTLAGQPIANPELIGARLTFTAGGKRHTALVSGDVMTAIGTERWVARRVGLTR